MGVIKLNDRNYAGYFNDIIDTSSNISRNTSVVSSFSCKCYVVGNIAYIQCQEIATSTSISAADVELLKGFPLPKYSSNFVGGIYRDTGSSVMRLRLQSDGSIRSWYNSLSGSKSIFFTISYPISDT